MQDSFPADYRISSCRVNDYLKKSKQVENITGKHDICGGQNKVSTERENEVIAHISRFPKYMSHYLWEFLCSNITTDSMYKMDKEEATKTMALKDFLGTSALEKMFVNRKKDVNQSPVSWLKTREIFFTKDEPYTLNMSTSFQGAPQKIDLEKKSPGRKRNGALFQQLQPL
ncbi:hypothetical protein PR048_014476 [Dryococelus australis]|uniref:Uncharacterized protein n=1 Tax=Dryococelus australis TaxID=614101 RepID=A0ABQ9HEH1_9NEOP|nr:hypothetical protein PR048_014476 [Dryococelus australis]